MKKRISFIPGISLIVLLLAGCGVSTTLSVIMKNMTVSDQPVKICERKLTSSDYMATVRPYVEPNKGDISFDIETTPVRDIFFWPEADIRQTELVELVRARYNYLAVNHHVQHAYELFESKSSGTVLETRQDTLETIAHDKLVVPESLLEEAFTDAGDRAKVEGFLTAYSNYDGRDYSPFWEVQSRFVNGVGDLDQLATNPLLDDFSEHFWEWYEKKVYVPELDSIAVVYLTERGTYSEKDLSRFKSAIEGETNINRRTILALELMRIQGLQALDSDTVNYLSEILESGIYTKYILEAWLAWRASVQVTVFGASTFSFIPNRYYDRVRVKAMNTILRHMQESPDKYDGCLLLNLMVCGPLQRMYFDYGNESGPALKKLQVKSFIQPSALGYDYLKEEK